MSAAAAALPSGSNHNNNHHESNPTASSSASASSIHASAAIPMRVPRNSRRIGGFVPKPSSSSSSPPPPLLADDYAAPPSPQRQLVWGEEELRTRIREVEEDVDTLRSTAQAHCLRGQWQKAEATLVRLYRGGGEGGDSSSRLERVGLPLALSFLDACAHAEAWTPALGFIDDVLLVVEEGEEEEEEEGKARLQTELATKAVQACVGAGDAHRVLCLLKRSTEISTPLFDLSLQACAAQQARLARRRKDESTSPPPPLPPPLGVTVLSLLREARRREGEEGVPSPSATGWEAAAAALTTAGPLRLLLAEAKKTGGGGGGGGGGVGVLPAPMWLYGKAIAASVAEGQAAEALLLYQEVLEQSLGKEEEEEEEGSSSSSIPLSVHEHALGAYASQGQWRPALAVLDRLKGQKETGEGVGPSLVCFNEAIRACCLGNEWERGVGLLRRMEAAGHRPNEGTYRIILQAFAKTGEWQGSLKLLEYIAKKAEEGGRGGGVTPALARAAAENCVRASRFEEARTLVGSVVQREEEEKGKASPAVLALGLWALAAATPTAWRGPARQEEALLLITQLMASGAGIALETYEHACQALLLTQGGGVGEGSVHDAALREVYRHGVEKGVLPSSSSPSSSSAAAGRGEETPTVELRGLRPTLAKVAMVTALEELCLLPPEKEGRGGGIRGGGGGGQSPPPLIIITGTGRVKTALQHFLRTSCVPPLLPQPMPYNAGRLLLPWAQIRRWKEAGGVGFLSSAGGGGGGVEGACGDAGSSGPRGRREGGRKMIRHFNQSIDTVELLYRYKRAQPNERSNTTQ